MFTGIIQSLATVESLEGSRLEISAAVGRVKKGDSIALNGVCLTAVTIRSKGRKKRIGFDIADETFKKTSLGMLTPGSSVNLETAARLGDPMGGHMVQGHVDGTGRILGKRSGKSSVLYRFSIPGPLVDYLVPKGSIAVDGISLTVVDVLKDSFTVAIIPHTETHTVLGIKKIGDPVNLETDVMAKFVVQFLKQRKKQTKR